MYYQFKHAQINVWQIIISFLLESHYVVFICYIFSLITKEILILIHSDKKQIKATKSGKRLCISYIFVVLRCCYLIIINYCLTFQSCTVRIFRAIQNTISNYRNYFQYVAETIGNKSLLRYNSVTPGGKH